MILTIGLIVVALLFAKAAIDHVADVKHMVAYTGTVLKNKYLAMLGGYPTALYLAMTSVGIMAHVSWGMYMGAAFLIVTQVLFHRDLLNDAGARKHAALAGALLALATLV